jgi:hypothetical protein
MHHHLAPLVYSQIGTDYKALKATLKKKSFELISLHYSFVYKISAS